MGYVDRMEKKVCFGGFKGYGEHLDFTVLVIFGEPPDQEHQIANKIAMLLPQQTHGHRPARLIKLSNVSSGKA